MSDTVTLKAVIYDQKQVPVVGSIVFVELTRYDIDVDDKQYIIPHKQKLVTDASGEVEFLVWRNSEGARASQYRLRACDETGWKDVLTIAFTVPDTASDGDNVIDYAEIEPFPPQSNFDIALSVVVEARDQVLVAHSEVFTARGEVIVARGEAVDAKESAEESAAIAVDKAALSAISAADAQMWAGYSWAAGGGFKFHIIDATATAALAGQLGNLASIGSLKIGVDTLSKRPPEPSAQRLVLNAPATVAAAGRYFAVGSGTITLPSSVGQPVGACYDIVTAIDSGNVKFTVADGGIKTKAGVVDSMTAKGSHINFIINNNLYEAHEA